MGHNYLYAHVSPKKLQKFNNKPARDLVLDPVLILTKDYCWVDLGWLSHVYADDTSKTYHIKLFKIEDPPGETRGISIMTCMHMNEKIYKWITTIHDVQVTLSQENARSVKTVIHL